MTTEKAKSNSTPFLVSATAGSTASSRTTASPAPGWLVQFIIESNRIEGITRPPTEAEIAEHMDFLADRSVSVASLEHLVDTICGEVLRDKPGMDVRVGNYYPPPGGPQIRVALDRLCDAVNDSDLTPFETHTRYERIHPFMDGNGRSGRALWLWMMQRNGYLERAKTLGFLHAFYYQTLDGAK